MNELLEVGTVVFSKVGRDSGRFYVVIEIVDDKYVKIADGDLRRLEKPKLKQVKHLKAEGQSIPKLAEKLLAGKTVFDAELRSLLRSYNG